MNGHFAVEIAKILGTASFAFHRDSVLNVIHSINGIPSRWRYAKNLIWSYMLRCIVGAIKNFL